MKKYKKIRNNHAPKNSGGERISVLDTSVIIEKVASRLIKQDKLSGKIIIPNAALAELEHQANFNQETGFIGLDELSDLHELARQEKIILEFQGPRPEAGQIKHAKLGEIDAIVRDLAQKNSAELITADFVQAKSAESLGISVHFIKIKKQRKALEIEKFFGKDTMSVHLKEDSLPYGKCGAPGTWHLAKLGEKTLPRDTLQRFSKEIVEKARMTENAFVEISKPGLTIVQYGEYRIVIVKPPISDGIEITAVRPIKKFAISHYSLDEPIMKRFEKARGIIIAGEPGSGKSTFAQALAEFYSDLGKIVKTVESPRDLQLPPNITQYSKNFASSSDIHDILFLSRPDYVIFDEMRSTPDFILYTDLRLAGSECIGVLHSASPIDAIQRFIGRLEIGMIASIVDTVIFVEAGKIAKILSLSLRIKMPSGMREADLSRPVIEVRDFATGKLLYELYKFGEETVVAEMERNSTGKGNKERNSPTTQANIFEDRKNIIIQAEEGKYTLLIDGRPLTSIIISRNGEARINKRSNLGNKLLKAIMRGQNVELS